MNVTFVSEFLLALKVLTKKDNPYINGYAEGCVILATPE